MVLYFKYIRCKKITCIQFFVYVVQYILQNYKYFIFLKKMMHQYICNKIVNRINMCLKCIYFSVWHRRVFEYS